MYIALEYNKSIMIQTFIKKSEIYLNDDILGIINND